MDNLDKDPKRDQHPDKENLSQHPTPDDKRVSPSSADAFEEMNSPQNIVETT